MMKLFLVVAIFALVSSSYAAPQGNKEVEILEYVNDNANIGGAYKFSYKTSDGVERSEEATVINAGQENESLKVTGTISWVAPDGQKFTINFVADENGFQPEGAHIPK